MSLSDYERTKRRRAKIRDWLKGVKASLFCQCCGESHPRCLEFHHDDPALKDQPIGVVIYQRGWSIKRIEAEMAKCTILCGNCHRILHYEIAEAGKSSISTKIEG